MTVAAPDTWSAPASGATIGTATPTVKHSVTHVQDYWLSVETPGASTTPIALRYASDPTGAWGTATLPAAPTGYAGVQDPYRDSGVIHDGTRYGFLAEYQAIGAGSAVQRIVYATDPTGTWSANDFDPTDAYPSRFIAYANGTVIVGGRYNQVGTDPAFLGYSSAANGTFTFTTGTATGYDESVLGNVGVSSLAYGAGTFVSVGGATGSSADQTRYSSALLSGWGTPSSPPSGTNLSQVRYHANGWWTMIDADNDSVWYTSSPSGTWTQLTAASIGLVRVTSVRYGNGYWIITGSITATTAAPRIAYLASSGSPSGTYTVVDGGFADPADPTQPFGNTVVRDVDIHGSYAVAGSDYLGELRWASISTGPTILRQRQSPVRTPSRVRGVNLRARQTPFIT